ncbi:erythrocyte membrane protein 1, EMP1 [Plasmodium reichenowi]|uniref:Erythrocyte membrane protein 1, EMP1 n=1 Tax=Plasmodium reichenowi TaxID=5854 RepID=A0A060RQH9_PLARE|nr:erythrocyte membrane protein 1, EMP1 [Plasmodium reichenowi]
MVASRPSGTAESAKEVLDEIGKQVHKKAKDEAEQRSNGELKGSLTKAINGSTELSSSNNPCTFRYTTELIGANEGKRHPCTNLKGNANEECFSNTIGGQCTDEKMRSGGKGDCAPFRRLHLCDKNLENINTRSTTSDTLLGEVCLAAKFEGQSIKGRYTQHQGTNEDSQLCTMLARSFADIGDIIRGQDLFYGNTQESAQRKKLDNKLKEVFGNIYNELTKTPANGQKSAQEYYKDGTKNYFQLREDWWTANRETVWKTITCDARDYNYFRKTCGGGRDATQTSGYCRCNGDNPSQDKTNTDPPTYFDYVPQYLRWFEEWAEDFCRLRKHKLQNAINFCGDNTKALYCSGNGYDCTQTIRGDEHFVKVIIVLIVFMHVVFVRWLDNQKQEFLKQKEKYTKEMKKYTNGGGGGGGSSRKKRDARSSGSSSDDNGYEKKCYKILNAMPEGVLDKFLDLISKENVCTQITEKEEGIINFTEKHDDNNNNNEAKGTFYHSKYCQVCPDCGVEHKGDGNFEDKDTTGLKCAGQNTYKPKDNVGHTPINFLNSGEKPTDFEKKLNEFCDKTKRNEDYLYEEWKCYKKEDIEKEGKDEEDYEYVKSAGGLCIFKKKEQENKSSNEPKELQKTFHDFFYYWVAHMLKDSIHWRTKLEKCLKNKKKCGNEQCKSDCECFENWVQQKKDEWDPIKEHFSKQSDLKEINPYDLLKDVLSLQFSEDNSEENSEGNSENSVSAREIHLINKMLKEDETEGTAGGIENEKNTPIDKLLKHEENDAEKCKKCENEPQDPRLARSETNENDVINHENEDNSESEDDTSDIENEENDEVEENVEAEESSEEDKEKGPSQVSPKVNDVDVCPIVKKALENTKNINESCSQKYGPKAPSSWRCIPTTTNNVATGRVRVSRDLARVSNPTGKDNGSICVPPRRRRLYIGKIKEWANTVGTTGDKATGSETSQGGGTSDQTMSESDKLRNAFIQSAAIETFFLWHNYTTQWWLRKQAAKQAELNGGLPLPFAASQGKEGPAGLRPGAGQLGSQRGPGEPPVEQLGAP